METSFNNINSKKVRVERNEILETYLPFLYDYKILVKNFGKQILTEFISK